MNIPYVFRYCKYCNRWLVASTVNFKKNKTSKYGLSSRCKVCDKKYRQEIKSITDNTVIFAETQNEILTKTCTKCGNTLPATTEFYHKSKKGKYGLQSQCKKCIKQYNENHKEQILKYAKQYYEENKEHQKNIKRQYYEKNKQYYKKKWKEYTKTPKGKTTLFNAFTKRRFNEQTQGNGITGDQWLEMMRYFDWKCAYSGITLNKDTRSIDHITPLTKGGEHEIWNLVPMYRPYNCSKNAKDLLEWYKEQPFFSEDRLQKIYEWQEYAFNKWHKEEIV